MNRAIAIALALLFSCLPAAAQGNKAACVGIDVQSAPAVSACLSTFPGREQLIHARAECGAVQGLWKNMLRGYGVQDQQHTRGNVPSCPVIAEAMRLANGTPAVWADCVPGKHPIGSEAHTAACLGRWNPGSYGGQAVTTVKTCEEFFNRYEMALGHATPRVVLAPPAKKDAGGSKPDLTAGAVQRIGPSPFDDPNVKPGALNVDMPVLRQRDCAVADKVIAGNPVQQPRPITIVAPQVKAQPKPTTISGDIVIATAMAALLIGLVLDRVTVGRLHKANFTRLIATSFPIEHHQAVVQGSRTWSQTHVHGGGTGGGGYIHPTMGGHVSPTTVTVSSTVVDNHEFFLQYPNGFEQQILIKSASAFPTREGQPVDALWHSEGEDRRVLGLRNRATKTIYLFDDTIEERAAAQPLGNSDWLVRGGFAALSAVLLLFMTSWYWVVAFLLALVGGGLYLRERAIKSWGLRQISQLLYDAFKRIA